MGSKKVSSIGLRCGHGGLIGEEYLTCLAVHNYFQSFTGISMVTFSFSNMLYLSSIYSDIMYIFQLSSSNKHHTN